MTRPLNPPRTITAPYATDHPPMPDRIKALLGKRAADLTRRELLDIAADAANRDAWDLCGDREHVGDVCDLAGTLEAEFGEALRAEPYPSGTLEDAITIDRELDEETRIATDAELGALMQARALRTQLQDFRSGTRPLTLERERLDVIIKMAQRLETTLDA